MKAVLAIAVAVALAAVLVVVSGSDPRRTGTNNVGGGEAARLGPGQHRCQPGETPGATRAVAVAAYSPGGEAVRLAVALRDDRDRLLTAGRTLDVAPNGYPLANLRPTPVAGGARVCVRNATAGTVVLLGVADTFGVDYYGDRESWWQAAPSIARHFGFGKAGFLGAWTFWLTLALIAAAWIGSWRALAGSGARS
jgi:hypothetical protein